jgi:membrane-bound serine protease (ClpP class)
MVSVDKEIIRVTFKDGTTKILTGVEYNDLTDEEKKYIKKKKTIVPKGELLTMSADEAEEFGFSRKTVKDLDEVIDYLKTKSREIVRITKKRSEKLLILMNKIAPVLILIGLAGLYMELKTPGFGMFGIIGITAFLLFFSTKYVVGLADHIEFILFFMGIALLFVELFVIPGFGIIGVTGVGLILVSVLLSMQNFVIPKMPWDVELFKSNILLVGILFLISVPLFFIALFSASKLVYETRLGHRETEATGEGFAPAEDYSGLIGKKGKVLNQLRPAGIAEIDGKRFDVVSDGEYIDKNKIIIVSETVGNRIVVRKAT